MWQHRRLTQVIAVVLAIVPIYGFAMWSHLTKDRPYSIGEMIFYPLVFGGISIYIHLAAAEIFLRGEVEAAESQGRQILWYNVW